jgi:hypothetical protein
MIELLLILLVVAIGGLTGWSFASVLYWLVLGRRRGLPFHRCFFGDIS